jgi:hypothetical protein
MASALAQIKDNPLGAVTASVVETVCRKHGYIWRNRELDPATTVALFMQQVAHGNCACTEVRHLDGRPFTAQAYCQARARLPLKIYQDLLAAVCEGVLKQTGQAACLWHGHRTFHIDGSTFSMSDTEELREAFGMPSGQKEGCGFPVAHLLVMFNAATGVLVDAIASPLRTGDLSGTPDMHQHLKEGDLLIGDDSFGSYTHLALLKQNRMHGLFPVHHLRIVDFRRHRPHTSEGKNAVKGMPRSRWIKSLGREDQLVEYFKPTQKSLWMSQEEYDAVPESIIVRELRRTVRRPGMGNVTLRIVTTLLDAEKYPAQEVLELRLRRWDVETNIGHLKTTMGMDVLHCKTEAGVRKELVVFCLVYNLVRVVMLEAARRQEVPASRISFADALAWMRHAQPGRVLPALVVNPWRPNRVEPRCKKRRPKQYDLMNRPRSVLRKRLRKQAKTA